MHKQSKPSTRRSCRGWGFVLPVLAALALAGGANAEDSRHSAAAKPRVASQAPAGVVNLNTATEEELKRLPGIGPSKAQAILKLRTKMGKFDRVEALLRVRGIGRKTLRKLRPMVTLQGKTTMPPPAGSKRPRKAK